MYQIPANHQTFYKIFLWNLSLSNIPASQVSHIDPGSPIKLYLYAENAKGTSDPAIIDDATLNQQKHYVEGKNI